MERGEVTVLHTDARFAATIEEVVREVEDQTDAEVVVVAAPRSWT